MVNSANEIQELGLCKKKNNKKGLTLIQLTMPVPIKQVNH